MMKQDHLCNMFQGFQGSTLIDLYVFVLLVGIKLLRSHANEGMSRKSRKKSTWHEVHDLARFDESFSFWTTTTPYRYLGTVFHM